MSEEYIKMFDFSSSEESEKEKYSKLKRNFKEIIIKTIGRSVKEEKPVEERSAKNKNAQGEAILRKLTDLKQFQKNLIDSLLTKTEQAAKRSKSQNTVSSSGSDSSVSHEKLQTVRKRQDNQVKKEKYEVEVGKSNVKKDGRYSPFSYKSEEVEESVSSESSEGSLETPPKSLSINSRLSLTSKSQSEIISEHSSYETSPVPSPNFFHVKGELCKEIRRKGMAKASSISSSGAEQTKELTDREKYKKDSEELYPSTKPRSSNSSETSQNRSYLQEKCHSREMSDRADSRSSLKLGRLSETESNKERTVPDEDKNVKRTNSNISMSEQSQATIVHQYEPPPSENHPEKDNVAKETVDETKETTSVVTSLKDDSTDANDVLIRTDDDSRKSFTFLNQSDDDLIRKTVQELEEMDREENLKTEDWTQIPTTYHQDTEPSLGGDGDANNCSRFNAMLLERMDRLQEEMTALRKELEEAKQRNQREAKDVSYMSNLLLGYNRPPDIRNGLQWEDWELKEMVRERMREKREAANLEYQRRLKAVEDLCTAELGRLEQSLEALVPLGWKASSWGTPALRSPCMTKDYFLEVVTSMNLSSSEQKTLSISTNGEQSSSVEPPKAEIQ